MVGGRARLTGRYGLRALYEHGKRRPMFVGKRYDDGDDYWGAKRRGPMFVGKRVNPFFVG